MLDVLRLGGIGDPLFGRDGLPLDGGVVVWPATRRTQSVHRRLDVVVAELTYLASVSVTTRNYSTGRCNVAYLVAAGTWSEVPVR
jgi:hypothetical protein